MFKRIDQSPFLLKILERVSTGLARMRGLPVVFGIMLVIIGFGAQVLNVFVSSEILELIGVIFHNGGVLIALIGMLLAEPLGK